MEDSKQNNIEILEYAFETKEIDRFVNRFGHNSSVDFEYFKHQLTGAVHNAFKKLDITIGHFIKIKNKHEKLTKFSKATTHKSQKELAEASQVLFRTYEAIITYMINAHHFQTTFLKILWVHLQRANGDIASLDEAPTSFNELVSSIDIINHHSKKTMLTFNKIRNILMHSPSEIINVYLTDKLLLELQVIIRVLHDLDYTAISSISKTIKDIYNEENERLENNGHRYVSKLKDLAKELHLTIKEVIVIAEQICNEKSCYHAETQLDGKEANKIVNYLKKIKERAEKDKEMKDNEKEEKERKIRTSTMLINIDSLLQNNKNEDAVINEICNLHTLLVIDELIIISTASDNKSSRIIDEVLFVANRYGKKQFSFSAFEDAEAYLILKNSASRDIYIVSKEDNIFDYFQDIAALNKYAITSKNKQISNFKPIKEKEKTVCL